MMGAFAAATDDGHERCTAINPGRRFMKSYGTIFVKFMRCPKVCQGLANLLWNRSEWLLAAWAGPKIRLLELPYPDAVKKSLADPVDCIVETVYQYL